MKLNKFYCTGVLAFLLAAPTRFALAQPGTAAQNSAQAAPDADDARIAAIPVDRLVTATCRQAWQLGGSNQDGFFDIVKRLAELSAQNRAVTLPDNKAAGARAGEWIRTQALKDPDQLLYAVVDHAVMYSIAKGRSTPAAAGTSAK